MTSQQAKDLVQEKIDKLLLEVDAVSSYKRAEALKQLGNLELNIQDIPLELHKKLEMALRDPEPEVRSEAIMALTFLERELAIPLIEPLINDKSDIVKGKILAALSYIGKPPNSVLAEKMIACLGHPNEEIRDRCARALGRLKVENSISNLLNLVKTDSSEIVRAGAVAAIGMFEIKDPTISNELEKILIIEKSKIVQLSIRETIALLKK